MSGTIPLSMTQQFDEFGQPLAGGLLFIIQAGTVSTPQNPYQDANLTLVMPNPITLDAAGRIPQFFLADGYIKIRLTDVNGVTQLAADGILVIGPSAGGGGGGPSIDPTTILATGDIKPRYDTAVISGFVRGNGRSIGSAASGGTELADASAQALFNYLWAKDTNLAVLPSRGASAAADWAANKTIALPDFRGCSLTGLDDMGNSAAGRLTASFFGVLATVLGAFGGQESRVLAANQVQIPQHQHAVFLHDPGHHHTFPMSVNNICSTDSTGGDAVNTNPQSTSTVTTGVTIGSVNGTANDNQTALSPAGAAALPHAAIGPRLLITIYIKL